MDSAKLHEIVKGWPKAAWPSDIIYGHNTSMDTHHFTSAHGSTSFSPGLISIDLATLAFEASGMRYIVGGLHVVETECCGDSGWSIIIRSLVRSDEKGRPYYLYDGGVTGVDRPDPLHAISDAVMAMAARRTRTKDSSGERNEQNWSDSVPIKDCYASPQRCRLHSSDEERRDFSKSPCNTGDYLEGGDDGELDYRTGED